MQGRRNAKVVGIACLAFAWGSALIAGTGLDVGGGVAATRVDSEQAVTSAGSLSVDGATDTITAAGGTLSFADDDLATTGTTSTGGLAITGLDCSGNSHGGALTASAGGAVSCSDDEGVQIAPDSLDFGDFADTLTADATTTVDLGGGALDLDAGTLFVDSSDHRVGVGTATPGVALDVAGDVRASGTIRADGGIHLATGSLDQEPGAPSVLGSVTVGSLPLAVSVSGRTAYVITPGDGLRVVDLSEPAGPQVVGSLALGGTQLSVSAAGRYVYVGGSGTLRVVDVADPSHPAMAGRVDVSPMVRSVFVSGRYAYAGGSSELLAIDVSDPTGPTVVGSLVVGTEIAGVSVSGRHAYTVDASTGELDVIDVSDPASPSLVGSLALGGSPLSLFVSGRYAYVTDGDSGELDVIDVAVPSAPSAVGSLSLGGTPSSIFVSGRYAYVVEPESGELVQVDVAHPASPSLAGAVAVGANPRSVFVVGRHAMVTDLASNELTVVDVTGAALGSAVVHSLEAGSLQVRDDLTVQGQVRVTGGATIGSGGLFSDGDLGAAGSLSLAAGTSPTASPAGAVQLYAEDSGGGAELRVRDEAGNVTTLSPHDFSLAGGPSEPLAWSYASENAAGRINVDMLRTVRLVERLSGERLVTEQAPDGSAIPSPVAPGASLRAGIEALHRHNRALRRANRELREELEQLEEVLGLQ